MSVADLRPAAEPGNIPTADELVARARALAPKLRERAMKAERDRNIPQESVDEYLASGLIHTLQPKRWGGYEHDHEVAFNVALELGKSTCGSSAWCLNYLERPCLHPGAFSRRGATRRLEPRQSRLHRYVGGADRKSVPGTRRLYSRRSLVVVQWAAPFAMDHDRWTRFSRGRRPSRYAAVPRAGVAGETGRHLVLCGIERERL